VKGSGTGRKFAFLGVFQSFMVFSEPTRSEIREVDISRKDNITVEFNVITGYALCYDPQTIDFICQIEKYKSCKRVYFLVSLFRQLSSKKLSLLFEKIKLVNTAPVITPALSCLRYQARRSASHSRQAGLRGL